jgi:hypothetical protein
LRNEICLPPRRFRRAKTLSALCVKIKLNGSTRSPSILPSTQGDLPELLNFHRVQHSDGEPAGHGKNVSEMQQSVLAGERHRKAAQETSAASRSLAEGRHEVPRRQSTTGRFNRWVRETSESRLPKMHDFLSSVCGGADDEQEPERKRALAAKPRGICFQCVTRNLCEY